MTQTLKDNAVSGQQVLTQPDIVFEYLLNALRLKTGREIKTFKNHTGLSYQALQQAVSHIDPALLILDKNRVRTTDKGYIFLNEILEKLLEE